MLAGRETLLSGRLVINIKLSIGLTYISLKTVDVLLMPPDKWDDFEEAGLVSPQELSLGEAEQSYAPKTRTASH